MIKADLARQLSNCHNFRWMSQRTATDVIETVLDLMICHFQDGGEEITIRGFGTLKLRHRRAFTGRDPRNGEPVVIPERKSLSFRPSAELLRRINS